MRAVHGFRKPAAAPLSSPSRLVLSAGLCLRIKSSAPAQSGYLALSSVVSRHYLSASLAFLLSRLYKYSIRPSVLSLTLTNVDCYLPFFSLVFTNVDRYLCFFSLVFTNIDCYLCFLLSRLYKTVDCYLCFFSLVFTKM